MGTERSDALYYAWRDAAEKFEYFVTGVSGALAAYVGQHLTVTTWALNGTTLELASLACFAASFLAGVHRMELWVMQQSLNETYVRLLETAGSSIEAAQYPVSLSRLTGQIMHSRELLARAQASREGAEELRTRLDAISDAGTRWYVARNAFLGVGVAMLVAARLLPTIGRP